MGASGRKERKATRPSDRNERSIDALMLMSLHKLCSCSNHYQSISMRPSAPQNHLLKIIVGSSQFGHEQLHFTTSYSSILPPRRPQLIWSAHNAPIDQPTHPYNLKSCFSLFSGSRVTAIIFKWSSFRPFSASLRFSRFWCLTSLDMRWYGGIYRFDMIAMLPVAKLGTY